MAAHGIHAGFVEEMRFVAMRLHTKDQAPKEGGQKAAEQPFQKVRRCWLPSALQRFVMFVVPRTWAVCSARYEVSDLVYQQK